MILTMTSVNPLYYVTFTTCTLTASFILFGGFNTTDAINTISLLCGFLTIFTGVYLLNLAREDPDGATHGLSASARNDPRGSYHHVDGIPTPRSLPDRSPPVPPGRRRPQPSVPFLTYLTIR